MIVSVTPEIALDEGNTYSGGLGVLEGDKFYGASKLGISYKVLTLFYRNGYVDYDFENETPIARPQPQPEDFLRKLVREGYCNVRLKSQEVEVEALKYTKGSAEVVFFNVLSPEWVKTLTDRIYMERDSEEKFYKYTLLAKASAEYIRRFMGVDEIDYIDLQEAYACVLPLTLKIPGKYRIIIHTAGPWGHPSFPRSFFEKEFGYKFISDNITLTEVGLAASEEAFAVSAKHFNIMYQVIPQFSEKLRYITNGVDIDRWMNPELKASYEKGELQLDRFIELRESIKQRFAEFIHKYKDVDIEKKLVAAWCRRLVPYKRPEFPIRAAKNLAKERNVLFVLGGKAHPNDGTGLEYMRTFRRLHEENENVVFIPDYSVATAKEILRSVDLLLFTAFPGWEACGTGYMKAAINGVPTLASFDGGVIELIVDDVNGWLFGRDVRELIEPGNALGREISEQEYSEFESKFRNISSMYECSLERYYKVSLNALLTSIPRVSIDRTLKEYYRKIIKV